MTTSTTHSRFSKILLATAVAAFLSFAPAASGGTPPTRTGDSAARSRTQDVLGETAINGFTLGGPVGYILTGTTLALTAGSICNHGSTAQTNNWRLELWAVASPFAGGTLSGTKLGESFTQGGVFQNQCVNNFNSGAVTLLNVPRDGSYFVVLFLDEYKNAPGNDDGFAFDDYSQLSSTIRVSGGVITTVTATSTCTPDATTLCVDDQAGDKRFRIQGGFSTSQGGGQSGPAHAIALSSLGVNQGGLMWFFSASNPELLLKVINGCAVNNSYWVFASAGTNVGLTITVTDTRTGTVKPYTNPDVQAFPPVQDTAAFPCH